METSSKDFGVGERSSSALRAQLEKQNDELHDRIALLERRIADLEAAESLQDGAAVQRLIEATEHCTDGFALFDGDDRFVLCNETYRAAMDDIADVLQPGLSFEDFLRIRASRNMRKDGIMRDEAEIQRRLEQHRNPTGPLERKYDDGHIIQLREHRIRDGFTVIIRTDVTAERNAQLMAEKALQNSEERFRALIDNANQGILIHRHYKPLYANQALAEMYGYDSPDEILALESTTLLHAPSTQNTPRFHEARLRGEPAPVDTETKGLRKDGTEFWLSRRSLLIVWEGEIASCNLRLDITEQKEAEQALRKAHAALERKFEARTAELRESDLRFRTTF
jgi:PAS domain S-box-containing protein